MRDDEFRAFYEEHARRLWAYLVRLTGDHSVADDIVQESFVRMLNLDRLDEMTPDYRRNYLFKTASNLAKQRAWQISYELSADMPAASQALDEVLALRSALNSMKERERSMLWLAYAERFSHREIGRILGYREGSVRILLHRAKQRLLALLGGEDPRKGGDQ